MANDKTKLELDRDIVNRLIKLKVIGKTYSDIIRELLDKSESQER